MDANALTPLAGAVWGPPGPGAGRGVLPGLSAVRAPSNAPLSGRPRKVPRSRASPGSRRHLLPARLGEDDYGPTAALEGGLHGAHGGGFCGVVGNGRQAAEFLK